MDFSSMGKLREVCAGDCLDDELYELLCHVETRKRLRVEFFKTYFAPEIQPVIAEEGSVNLAAYEYGLQLLSELKESVEWGEKTPDEARNKARGQGFRKTIVSLYEHRSAL